MVYNAPVSPAWAVAAIEARPRAVAWKQDVNDDNFITQFFSLFVFSFSRAFACARAQAVSEDKSAYRSGLDAAGWLHVGLSGGI
jgi:hypothetical protein